MPVLWDHESGIVVLHWSRQIGKSFVLAAWAVQRLMCRPGRLVTVLSNSRENGAEFLLKCVEVCRIHTTPYETVMSGPELEFEDMRMELRIENEGRMGRIKVLAANPRTARGFSGDLILDEFAFHENGQAIWEAAEPILASNKDYLCRIASTGNGRRNLFYRMVENVVNDDGVSSFQCSVFSKKEGKAAPLPPSRGRYGATSPGPVASQARHELVAPQETCAPRNVVPAPASRGEGDVAGAGCLTRVEEALAAGLSGVKGEISEPSHGRVAQRAYRRAHSVEAVESLI